MPEERNNRTATRAKPRIPSGGVFSGKQLAVATVSGLVLGAVVAWMANSVQRFFAPWLVFPLLVGALLGLMAVIIARGLRIGHRPTLLLMAGIMAVVATVGQHVLSYREHALALAEDTQSRELAAKSFPNGFVETAPIVPDHLIDFLRQRAAIGRPLIAGHAVRGWIAWATWAIDGIASLGAAMAVVISATRRPYCDQCGSWYQSVRGGNLSMETAKRLIETLDMPAGRCREMASAQYRLNSCNGGCGPTEIVVSWKELDRREITVGAWIESDLREPIARLLDESIAMDAAGQNTGEDDGPN